MPATLAATPNSAAADLTEPRWRWLAQRAWRTLWFVAIPALLAVVYIRYAVPNGAGVRGDIGRALVRLVHDQLIPLGVGSFLAFTFLFRYWRQYLPGARWLVTAGDFARWMRKPRQWNALEQNLSPKSLAEFAAALQKLDAELGAGDIAAAARTERAARALAAPALRAGEWRHTLQAIAAAALAATAAVLLRGHVLAPVRVLSGSMLPGLTPGDLLLADRTAYRALLPGAVQRAEDKVPRRGDIIVVEPPEAEGASEPLIKRVIGVPGDRIAMRGSRPLINGWEVPSCDAGHYLFVLPDGAVSARLVVEFLEDRIYLTIAAPGPKEFRRPYEVKPGEVFVLGDNRNNSSDSRAWNDGHGGGASLDKIVGRARSFLFGARRDQSLDASRLFERIDGTRVHLEGTDLTALHEGIAKCLAEAPKDTHVPAVSADAPDTPFVPDAPIPFQGE